MMLVISNVLLLQDLFLWAHLANERFCLLVILFFLFSFFFGELHLNVLEVTISDQKQHQQQQKNSLNNLNATVIWAGGFTELRQLHIRHSMPMAPIEEDILINCTQSLAMCSIILPILVGSFFPVAIFLISMRTRRTCSCHQWWWW